MFKAFFCELKLWTEDSGDIYNWRKFRGESILDGKVNPDKIDARWKQVEDTNIVPYDGLRARRKGREGMRVMSGDKSGLNLFAMRKVSDKELGVMER